MCVKYYFLAGTIHMDSILGQGSSVDVQFSGFESEVDILMYFVALSNNTDATKKGCAHYVSHF